MSAPYVPTIHIYSQNLPGWRALFSVLSFIPVPGNYIALLVAVPMFVPYRQAGLFIGVFSLDESGVLSPSSTSPPL